MYIVNRKFDQLIRIESANIINNISFTRLYISTTHHLTARRTKKYKEYKIQEIKNIQKYKEIVKRNLKNIRTSDS